MTSVDDNVVQMRAAENLLRHAFLGWQCRLRQLSMRDDEGRPSIGMMPTLHVADQEVGKIAVVISKLDSEMSTAEFRHIAKRTYDPKERFEAALRYFQSSYYQHPKSFNEKLTAVFSIDAELPKQLEGRDDCQLTFAQFNQIYELSCQANLLGRDDEKFQSTYWHNKLFNPALPADVQIICFHPDWSRSKADPMPIK